ncbi:hypothetical protein [Marinomonas epiphytica]
MKRLYYITRDLDDAEAISNEVHRNGVDDHHFYVISRDSKGIQTHHLHGTDKLEDTGIIRSQNRAYRIGGWSIVGILALTLVGEALAVAPPLPFLLFLLALSLLATVAIKVASSSFDGYLMELLNHHLDQGEAVLVLDVSKEQVEKVDAIMDAHPKAKFIADCSNADAAIPE